MWPCQQMALPLVELHKLLPDPLCCFVHSSGETRPKSEFRSKNKKLKSNTRGKYFRLAIHLLVIWDRERRS